MNDMTRHLRFQRRPAPVLPEHRPLYKIAQTLLILHLSSRGGRSGLPRLHLLNWALKDIARARALSQTARSGTLNVKAWGFDPALAIALRYACAEGLVVESGARYQITDEGVLFAKAIMADAEILPEEKLILSEMGKSITEAMVEQASKEWER